VHESERSSDRWRVRGDDPAPGPGVPDDPGVDRRSRGRTFVFVTCAVILAIATSASVLHTGMLLFVRSVGEAKVPDLVGLDVSAARVDVERAGLSTVVEREIYTSDYGEGRVVSQRPGAGRALRRGRKIHLTVSLGMKETKLPELVGLTLRQAGLELQEAGFVEGGIRRVPHPTAEKGVVIAQDPPAGSLGTEGAPVDLLICIGPSTRLARLPDVTGLPFHHAQEILRKNGFLVAERRTRAEANARPATVLDQYPAPGSFVPRGQDVGLTLARGEGADS
jgi:beta-lactam-binding protein with PASTA domain